MLPLAASLLLGLTMQSAQTAPPTAPVPTATIAETYNLFMQGRMLESGGDTAGAIAAYRKAVVLSPKSADIHAELAALYARDGKGQDAIAEGNAALAIDPNNREAHRILGLVYSALGDSAPLGQASTFSKQALTNLEAAYAAGVREPLVLLTLGRLYVQGEQYAKGIEVITNFLLAEPGYPDAVMLLTEAYDSTGQTAQAIATLEPLAAEQPQVVRGQTWLADLYERSGRWKEAAAKWGTLAVQTPKNPTYRVRRAGALINGGDVAQGRDILLDAVKDAPNDAAGWYLLSQAQRRLGNAAGAEDAATHIIALDATDPRGPLAMSESKTASKDFKGAAAVLDPVYMSLSQGKQPNPSFAYVATAYSEALRQSGDAARATRVLEDASRQNPDDADLTVALANNYEKSGHPDQAERALRAGLAMHPDQAEVLNSLGYMLANRGQKLDEAVTLINHALSGDASNPSYLDSLGWAYFKAKKYPEAAASLERAATALPRDSAVQDHLAEVYFQQKRYREAADTWTRALDGDRLQIDEAVVTKKRDHARELAK